MGCIYLFSLYALPIVVIASFFVEGWTKFWLMSAVETFSFIVIFVKAGWFKTWKEARAHGVKLSRLSALGPTPIHALYAIIAPISYIYAWVWMIATSTSVGNTILNVLGPFFLLLGLWFYHAKANK